MTNYTGCWKTWMLEMSRINLTIYSHKYHDIQVSSVSQEHSTRSNVISGSEKTFGTRSQYFQWIALPILPATKMIGKLPLKQPLMKWYLELCTCYMNLLYWLPHKMTQMSPTQHWMIHCSKISTRWDHSENGECHILLRPQSILRLHHNPISE